MNYDVPTHLKTVEILKEAIAERRAFVHVPNLHEGARFAFPALESFHSYITRKDDMAPYMLLTVSIGTEIHKIKVYQEALLSEKGSITLTPAGMLTDEGCKRVEAAAEAMHDGKAGLCNWLLQLSKQTNQSSARARAKSICEILNRKYYRADWEELQALIEQAELSEENFVRAVANRPAREPQHVV